MDCNCCEKLQEMKDKIADLELEIHRAQEDFYSSLYLVARIREALGDNGLRMQDELIEYCKALKQRSDYRRSSRQGEHGQGHEGS